MAYRMLAALALGAACAVAAPESRAALEPDIDLDEVLAVESSGHLDQLFRKRGFEEYQRGRHGAARRYFEYAAKYADKTSQFALATMYRNGEGVARDLATAYAWLDLAAERGYPSFLAEREAVWNALDEGARERAIEVATELYPVYGDAVAKRRHADHITRYLRKSIASHPSLAGGHIVTYHRNCSGAVRGIDAFSGGGCRDDDYFVPERFDPDAYWAEQDALWIPRGEVEVRPLQVPATRARLD